MIRQTSIMAYKELKGKLGERQRKIYQMLKEYGPCTARELHQKLVEDGNEKAIKEGPNFVKPRITELKEYGFVAESEARMCNVTGRTAHEVYAVEI